MVDLETQYYRIACLNGKWRGGGGELLQGRHWVQIAVKFLTNWYIYTAWKQLQEMGMVGGVGDMN